MFETNSPELTLWNVVFSIIAMIALLCSAICGFYHNFVCPEIDYLESYSKEKWVIIMGGPSDQGRRFAFEFATRGFNLLLVGSKRNFDVQEEIEATFVGRKVGVVLKDFTRACETDFFGDIDQAMEALPPASISFLIDNIAHHAVWNFYLVGAGPPKVELTELIQRETGAGLTKVELSDIRKIGTAMI
jgi:NAD(P)-dependent dehydrogenase (short-subunit alcohol dehydrogenase family)